VGDFELTFQYRIEKGNSGVQYRSKELAPGPFGPIISGYQADFEAGKTYSGILYEETGRGILAKRGEKTVIKPGADGKKPVVEVTGSVGTAPRSRRPSRTKTGTSTASSPRAATCSISSTACRRST
jgi:hypothetical protein